MTGGTSLTSERIRGAAGEPHNWLTYWGDYQGTHYSGLQQITTANVGQLRAAWARQLPGSSVLEATPLVVDGVMYTSGPPGIVVALDAATGRQIWRYQRAQKVRNPNEINPFNRGVAIWEPLFVGTLDAALLALDARTGALLWEVQMADPMQGFSITSPPLPLEDKIIAGIAGGEFGIRGFIDAYDPATGARGCGAFRTVPGPARWPRQRAGDSWKLGCGATWLPGSYDPELNLLYWAVGNPCPLYNGALREGDNLFTSSVVALDPATGQRRWHFQFSPHDTHDWDANQDMVLVDRSYHGEPRKLLMHADRNGHFYVLDRTNGKFLAATPFTAQTWNSGFDANGRPIVTPGSQPSAAGSVVAPSIGGGTNFQAPSYSPATGLVYLAYQDGGQRHIKRACSCSGARAAALRRARRRVGAGAHRRHQGDRSRERQDRLELPADSGFADRRRPRDGGRRGVRREPRGLPLRAGRADGRLAVAVSDRRGDRRVADQLRRGGEAVRRRLGGQRRLQLCAAGMKTSSLRLVVVLLVRH